MQHEFEHNLKKTVTTKVNIQVLVNKFKRTGSVLDEKHPERPQISEEGIRHIQQLIEQSPNASTHCLSNRLSVSPTVFEFHEHLQQSYEQNI